MQVPVLFDNVYLIYLFFNVMPNVCKPVMWRANLKILKNNSIKGSTSFLFSRDVLGTFCSDTELCRQSSQLFNLCVSLTPHYGAEYTRY